LHCALFTEDINQARDVGGWRKLKKEDYETLALRVEESKLEMIKENEEIQPDELVQAAFQGEIRKSPPGLTADLLPFQVEGASWMYCQEVNVPENRGGTLADEMGMVSGKNDGRKGTDYAKIQSSTDFSLSVSIISFCQTGKDDTDYRDNIGQPAQTAAQSPWRQTSTIVPRLGSPRERRSSVEDVTSRVE
jgi:hypothetical protein